MACESRLKKNQTLEQRIAEVRAALRVLEQKLKSGQARVIIANNGAVAFAGWSPTERADLNDACAYRTLALENSWPLRQAVAAAERQQGRRVNAHAVASGFHSHDHGKTWNRH